MSKAKKSKQKQTAKTIVVATLKGKIDITRSGIGYVIVDNNAIDIMVRPSDMSNALHGDIVRVKITRENGRTGKKEGKVVEVVERRQTEFIGHIQLSDKFAFFVEVMQHDTIAPKLGQLRLKEYVEQNRKH